MHNYVFIYQKSRILDNNKIQETFDLKGVMH